MGATTRFSTNGKRVSAINPTIKLPTTRALLQPSKADSRNPYTSPARPVVATSAPSQSILCGVALRDSGTCHNEIATTAAASGTLIKKTQCQEACSINHPPRTGPKAVVMAVNPDPIPISFPPDISSKEALIIARLVGSSAAEPRPSTQTAPVNFAMPDARPNPT